MRARAPPREPARALENFCRAARQGRFAGLADRGALWRLLVHITKRKATDLKRYHRRLKRGAAGGPHAGPHVRNADVAVLDRCGGHAPSAELAEIVAENCRELLRALDDPGLEALALAKFAGLTNIEAAVQFTCSLRTIERRMDLIRRKFEGVLASRREE